MRTFRRMAGFIAVNVAVAVILTMILSGTCQLAALINEARNDKYDTLFLGHSHGEVGIDPFLASEILGGEATSCAYRLTPFAYDYYILKEANKDKHLKRVVVEIDPTYITGSTTKNNQTVGHGLNIFYDLSGINKLEYIKNIMMPRNYNQSLFDYDIGNLNLKTAKRNITIRKDADYWKRNESYLKKYDYLIHYTGTYEYKGRGFSYGLKKVSGGVEYIFDKDKVKDECIEAFDKMVKYCKQNDIELIFTRWAVTPYRMKNENPDEVYEYFSELCKKNDVPYYDMNYLKKEYFSKSNDDFIDNEGHMLGYMAERQTEVLCNILKSDDKEKYFYTSFDEVMENLE